MTNEQEVDRLGREMQESIDSLLGLSERLEDLNRRLIEFAQEIERLGEVSPLASVALPPIGGYSHPSLYSTPNGEPERHLSGAVGPCRFDDPMVG